MKFLHLIALLSVFASANGQLMNMDESEFAPQEAPEMVVYYFNPLASPSACTELELGYIASKMLPDIDMALVVSNYVTPSWEVTSDPIRRQLQNAKASNKASGAANCNFCRRLYPRNLCNAIYNCNFRRQLRNDAEGEVAATRELTTNDDLAEELLADCRDNIRSVSYNRRLSRTCQRAIRLARCNVEFV